MLASVQQLNVDSIHNEVMAIIRAKGRESKNTARAYYDDFVQFCRVALGKELEELTEQDLVFKAKVLIDYQDLLCKQYAGATVNRKINSVRSIFAKLAVDHPCIRMEVFNAIDPVKLNTKHNGVLTLEETKQMIELAKTLRYGTEKSLVIALAAQTGIRLSAIMNAKWSDFKRVQGVWVFSALDKGGKLDEKPIPDSLYNDLLQLKRNGTDRLFTLDKRTIQRTVTELAEMMGIPKERKITFHSLKKMGINYILDTTGDVNKAAQFANHKNIQTMYESYADKQRKDFASMPSYTMMQEIDLSPLEALSKEELLSIIKQCKESTKIDILSRV